MADGQLFQRYRDLEKIKNIFLSTDNMHLYETLLAKDRG